MTISIWRYSHLVLAISSSLFLCIASVTGIILAFEPITNAVHAHTIKESENLTLAEVIPTLKANYEEVINFEINANDAVIASVITKDGQSETIYIDPLTGKKLGTPTEKAAIFKFATNLHRSLFLKSIGRFFVGLISFLLIIIVITGIFLILKRQGGIRHFFAKIEKEYFAQYYHVTLGRFLFIPVLIVAATGVYLSLERFSIIPKTTISHDLEDSHFTSSHKITIQDFEIFKTTLLKDVKSVEFPFSEAPEDYFLAKLSDRELIINQFDGSIISEQPYPFVAFASSWSSLLHTGQGSPVWSIILLITSCALLFFMYSGFTLTIKRRKNSPHNMFNAKKDEAEYIILVGSETGSTFMFANLFASALSTIGKKVFISELNTYTLYQKAQYLIIFTSTYGIGEPPANAKKFEYLFKKITPIHPLQYAVVGLGSLAYPHFCQYALNIDKLLGTSSKLESILDPYKINNQSFTAFKDWVSHWNTKTGITLKIESPSKKRKIKQQLFTVIERSERNTDDTFLLRLRPQHHINFESGDLLAFYPKEDQVERLYSIGKVDNDLLLAIKKHEFGICSNYFSKLTPKETIKAVIKRNPDFHLPNTQKEIILIANGTGIAPFLGMILNHQNFDKTHLFWGGRTKTSIKIYDDLLRQGVSSKKISSLHLAYSQEEEKKEYIQDLVAKESRLVANALHNNGIVMICGSIAMQKDIIKTLETIVTTELGTPLANFQRKNQIKMDCY
ncbi:PepSY domain-containing protein [Aquimarina algicola]|uniref:NADPH--hemoprotein reductase n=1 Tax=Aquimarina algicola TaxID=2589995 RepID=A0A504JKG4_9FLAO|nr:PepSY domain-containing protein [Aquimarina algicola]TPN87021.1 FAD-binding oxidoreductase [Aquimarina algicola]